MDTGLQGKTVIVTGSSSGNGRAIALAFAAEGATLVCADLRREPLPDGYDDDVATDVKISEAGGTAEFVEADVTSTEAVDALVARAVESLGRLDVMVNNAGIFTGVAPIVDESDENFDRTMAVNVRGTWLGCRAAFRQMLTQDVVDGNRGKIVNLASIAGVVGQSGLSPYSASKGAIINLTRALGIEGAEHRIHVNAIGPGYLPTAMVRPFLDDEEAAAGVRAIHPWPELGSPSDIGDAAVFLASARSKWVTGALLMVDGGMTAA